MDTRLCEPVNQIQRPYHIVDLNYVSLYVQDVQAASAFYSQLFGAPASIDEQGPVHGWRMGATWLTLLPSKAGSDPTSNPRNTEFAVQVAATEEVDRLYAALLAAGACGYMAPANTRMYEPMRFACVDDPFGVRIDIYCPMAAGE